MAVHAQLLPIYHREPSINLGEGRAQGKVPHLVGEPLLRAYGIEAGSRKAYAFSHVDFEAAAHTYGKVGGFAHLATLIQRLKGYRPKALLLDGGDSWQGSATALWTAGQDIVEASSRPPASSCCTRPTRWPRCSSSTARCVTRASRTWPPALGARLSSSAACFLGAATVVTSLDA